MNDHYGPPVAPDVLTCAVQALAAALGVEFKTIDEVEEFARRHHRELLARREST